MQNTPPKPAEKLSREEVARRELGHTDMSRSVAVFLTVMFLITLYSVPVIQHAAGWLEDRGDGPASSLSAYVEFNGVAADMHSAWSGAGSTVDHILDPNAVLLERMTAYQESLDETCILTTATQSPVQALMCRLGVGNEKAIIGRDGWLFFEPGLRYVTAPGFLETRQLRRRRRGGNEWQAPVQPDPIVAIIDFRNQLRDRGIELIVMPVPVKATIHPEQLAAQLTDAAGTALQNVSYELFLRRLRQEGVLVFDCAPQLAKRASPSDHQFLKTDTHWTPAAMITAADELTAFIGQHIRLPTRPPANYFRQTMTVRNYGDISVMLRLPTDQKLYPPEKTTIAQIVSEDGVPWYNDAEADILLLGDSFANIYSLGEMGWGTGAGLVEQLSYGLQRPVERLVRNADGAYAPRQQLARDLARGHNRLGGKTLVIWEFAARELAVGDWKLIALKEGTPTGGGMVTPGGVTATGTVAQTSPRPDAGADYANYIMKLYVTELKDELGKPVGDGDGVLHVLAMRDRKILPVAAVRRGARISVRLRPWREVKDRYGSIASDCLPDRDLEIEKSLYWCEIVSMTAQSGYTQIDVHSPQNVGDSAVKATAAQKAFLADCAAQAAAADERGARVVAGTDQWIFLSRELRHMGLGKFWGPEAKKVSRAKSPEDADPVPTILDFHAQLKALDIELILVPVPCKAVIYPDKISKLPVLGSDGRPRRADPYHQALYALLRAKGVTVLDLTDTFLAARERDEEEGPIYCRQDTHWSPRACRLAARKIHALVEERTWLNDRETQTYMLETRIGAITGDLWRDLADTKLPKETLTFHHVGIATEFGLEPVPRDRGSPVLLLADSHGLVFNLDGDMHARGAGLPDHLMHQFGFAIDRIARRGSAATSVRIDLARKFRGDNAYRDGKKLIVWCFSAREFTEANGWRKLALTRPK